MNSKRERSIFGPGLLALLMLSFGLVAGNAFAAKPSCGDGKCSGGETATTCPADCGDVCGDGICQASETPDSCAQDCGGTPPGDCNNDGVCNAGEDCLGCADCAGKTDGKPKNRWCCGADTCEAALCGAFCGDPAPYCGNRKVEYGEQCDDGPSGSATCDSFCNTITSTAAVPLNQFNIGDSIGEGEAANGTVGDPNHESV